MNSYVFDVKFFMAIRVDATTETEARHKLESSSSYLTTSFEPDGVPIIAEASVDGVPDLVEINGKAI